MIDLILANKLVKAVARGAHLLLVGDVDQLPSVGAGEVLRDLLAASGAVPRVRLSKIFRQAQQSGIVVNAHRVNAGAAPRLDGFADAEHIAQRVNLAVVAKAPLPRILAHAKQRGWRRLRLLSSATSMYNSDYLAENADGSQMPMLNVFRRDGGTIRHFWGSELLYAPSEPGQDPRHGDTIDALWNLFDLTPEGRGTDWYPELSYS